VRLLLLLVLPQLLALLLLSDPLLLLLLLLLDLCAGGKTCSMDWVQEARLASINCA
jgi:hypothetical protein